MLESNLSFFEGAAQICALRHQLGAPENDPDLMQFVVIGSETDHLPLQEVRGPWSAAIGDKGKHARISIGMAELPLNVPFEVEVIAVLE